MLYRPVYVNVNQYKTQDWIKANKSLLI
ncbi:MAG: hypothetical protein JWR50_2437, partial [Mucilaginibacter sp.]|nr:hypothetical protein [Mucilaginibacter sp.]